VVRNLVEAITGPRRCIKEGVIRQLVEDPSRGITRQHDATASSAKKDVSLRQACVKS